MNDERDEAIRQLHAAMTQAMQMIADHSMRIRTMRDLLYEHGIFSHAEHEQMHTVRLQQWNDFVQARLPAAVDANRHDVIRRLLEEFEDRKH